MVKQPKTAALRRREAYALEAEYRRFREEQGMEPTLAEVCELRIWALLVVWQGGGVVAPFRAEE